MTREEILGMSVDQLAEATAVHVMGWEWCEPTITWNAVSSGYWWSLSLEEPVFDWNPAKDISAAYEIEEKIKEIGGLMIGYYMTELILIVGSRGFDLVHATPAQRSKAALLALLAVLEG